MPRPLNDFSMTLVTSLSRPGRIFGSASRMVTLVPRSASSEANSQPITPAADDGGALGQLADRQELVGGHDDLAVDVEPGQRARHRAGRQHDGVAGELHVARLAAGHRDLLAGVEPAVPVEDRDLAALEQRRRGPDTRPVDDLVLAGQRRAPVDRGLAGVDAEVGRLVDVQVGGGRLEELLGRDAPDVEAGAAELPLLDHRDVEAGGRAVQRGGVAAGTAADDDDVVVLGRGDHLRG